MEKSFLKEGLIALIAAVMVLMAVLSCQKLSTSDKQSDSSSTGLFVAATDVLVTTTNQELLTSEQSISNVNFNSSDDAVFYGTKGHGEIPWGMGLMKFGIPHIDSCATVTVSSDTFPKQIIIDYGTDCTDKRGHTVSGKIIIDISDTLTNEGATKTITYQDFSIDSMTIELNATEKNIGLNADGHWVIEKTLDQTVTKNSDVYVQISNETIEWLNGFGNTDRSDNIYYISGSGSITLNDSVTYSKTITNPLLIDRSCDYIESGVVELYRNGYLTIIDYGDGTCDNVATVTVNDSTQEITLRSHWFGFESGFGDGASFGDGRHKHKGHGGH